MKQINSVSLRDVWHVSVQTEVEQDKASLQNAPAKYSEPVCDGEKFSIKSGKFPPKSTLYTNRLFASVFSLKLVHQHNFHVELLYTYLPLPLVYITSQYMFYKSLYGYPAVAHVWFVLFVLLTVMEGVWL